MSDVVDAIVADLKTIRDRGELVAYLGSATRSSAGRCWPALTAVPRAGRDRVREERAALSSRSEGVSRRTPPRAGARTFSGMSQ